MTAAFLGKLKRARRTFTKDGNRSLVIEDEIEATDQIDLVTWQLVTQADISERSGGATLE